jgi:PAS domain-containing protein
VPEEQSQAGDAAETAFPWRLPGLKQERGLRGWVVSAALVLAAALLHHAMLLTPATHHLAERAPFSLMYPAVTLAALIGGTGPGLLATAIATAIECFRLNGTVVPTLPTAAELPRLGLFVAVNAMIVAVCSSVQRARRRTEGALAASRRAERRAQSILESINDAFYSVDAQWRYTYVNHKCEEYYG